MRILKLSTRKSFWIAGMLCLSAGFPAFGGNYPNTGYFGKDPDKKEAWYQYCMDVKNSRPPSSDLPTKSDAEALSKCEPEASYYDTRYMDKPSTSDWSAVVRCAHVKNDSMILMMLYANGFGVKRDLRLAMMYACRMESAPAEMEFRIDHLSALTATKNNGKSDKYFDVCDDITSGMMQGYCESMTERQREKKREHHVLELVSKFDAQQKVAFDKLRIALKDFANARGGNETDASGTARAAMAIESESIEKDQFLSDIDRFESGKLPASGKERFSDVDKELNRIYQSVMHAEPGEDGDHLGYTTVTKEDIRRTQRIWLKYRDAMVEFGTVRYPSVGREAWLVMMTKRRVEQLKELYEFTR